MTKLERLHDHVDYVSLNHEPEQSAFSGDKSPQQVLLMSV